MNLKWKEFCKRHPKLSCHNPFENFQNQYIEWSKGRWIVFIPEEKNHGMQTSILEKALKNAFIWAHQKNLNKIATNGIANTDHGRNKLNNRLSDNERAAWLYEYACLHECSYNFEITLASLNDVFIRG
jgi:hypothetical protein